MAIKITKVLIIAAIVVAALALICGLTIRLLMNIGQQPTESAATTKESVRPELFQKYFGTLSLDKNSYTPTDQPQVKWQLQPNTPAKTQAIFKVLNLEKDIFVSETSPVILKDFTGSYFGNPKTPGNYELWVYLIESDNNQSLADTLLFSVK